MQAPHDVIAHVGFAESQFAHLTQVQGAQVSPTFYDAGQPWKGQKKGVGVAQQSGNTADTR